MSSEPSKEAFDRLNVLADSVADEFFEESEEILKNHSKSLVVRRLLREVAQCELDILRAKPQDRDVLTMLRDTKLKTALHVMETERIIASREIAEALKRGFMSFLKGFGVIAKDVLLDDAGLGGLLKSAAKNALRG